MTFKTVAKIVNSYSTPSGIVFELVSQDESAVPFKDGFATNEIGAFRMAQLVRACNIVAVHDTDQLHGKLVVVSYRIREGPRHVTKYEGISDPLYNSAVFTYPPEPKPTLRQRIARFFDPSNYEPM